jgi:hypothetical protein
MKLIPTLRKPATDSDSRPQRRSLDDLFAEADELGRLFVFTSDRHPRPVRHRVHIDFDTMEGTELSAKSDFGLPIHEAFEQAIARARAIRGQFK